MTGVASGTVTRLARVGACLAAGLLALATAACNKGPAEAALKAADQSIEAARPDLEKYVPQELQALLEAARAAHAEFDRGNYKQALTQAQALPAKIEAALQAALATRRELARRFSELQASMPPLLEALTARVTELAGRRRGFPPGLDLAKVQAGQAELPTLAQTWRDSATAFQRGDVTTALEKALTLKVRAEELAQAFGVAPASPPSPAPQG
jgi:hypothetical protein